MFPSILIVDDEPTIIHSLKGLLIDDGFEVISASNGYSAMKLIESESPDLVLLDIWMPGMDGIETLKEIKKNNTFIQVIIITGHGTVETAVKATKLGAFDLIEKPLSFEKVIVSINNALNFRRLEEENKYLRKKTIEKHSINGNSQPVLELKKQIAAVAPTDSWVLIKGENGTGKELVARTIHQLSNRATSSIVDVNCAAIPEELIESELFGHEKGYFSTAATKKRGKFELANNGTIFLDEIGDMSLKTQSKILRVLQEKKFQRVGGTRILDVDVRVIAATNKDIEKEIATGAFREDLFYRLNVVPIEVPSLRERKEDIPLLVDTFLKDTARQARGKCKGMSTASLTLLQQYDWPGNVRELKNLIERLTIMTDTDLIEAHHIPSPYNPNHSGNLKIIEADLFSSNDFKTAKIAFEKAFIQQKLVENHNNITNTAKAIGIERNYLYRIIKKYSIKSA
jgi:two-component system nitrogen regulation response regulator NtrX